MAFEEQSVQNIRFNVKPKNKKDSVLVYIAATKRGTGDFAALVIKNRRYEFRFKAGKLRLIPSFS